MGIEVIKIKRYKSLHNIEIDFNRDKYDLECIIGKNGAGKSNILDAINYFYNLLKNDKSVIFEDTIDLNNKYIQSMEIEIIYCFSQLIDKRNSNSYIDNIISDLSPYIRNNRILLRLTQYRDGSVEWYPHKKEIRKDIAKLFPIYMIDTRFISLNDWSVIWQIISDFSISNIKEDEKQIETKIDELMDKIYGSKYSKALKKIENIFEKEKIKISKHNYNERYLNTLLTRLGGSQFLNENKKIDYYSDGTKSLKYIKLVILLISYLTDTGWKNPLLIIDEPEIGLHPQFIEELVDCLLESNNDHVNVLLTTHSAHLVTTLIKNSLKVNLRRISMVNYNSRLEKIKDIIDIKDKYLISNKETECYFSNAILFVEGTTEMQLLQYPKIKELFNYMKYIKFFPYDSNISSLKLIHPNKNNYTVPFLILSDMDKIIKYNCRNKKFEINKDSLINPLYDTDILKKQKLLYFGKDRLKYRTLNFYQYIRKTIDKCVFEHNGLFWMDNPVYTDLIENIKNYCLCYNVVALDTTIEGAIVNQNNYLIIIEWLKSFLHTPKSNKLDELLNQNKSLFYKVSILRLILNGKLDNQLSIKEAKKEGLINAQLINDINFIHEAIGKKTEGWIIKFFDFYFNNIIDKKNNLEEKRLYFQNDFPELNNILQLSHNMLKYLCNE